MQGFITNFRNFKNISTLKKGDREQIAIMQNYVDINNDFDKINGEKIVVRITGKAGFVGNIHNYYDLLINKYNFDPTSHSIIFDGDNLDSKAGFTLLIDKFANNNFDVYCVKKIEEEADNYFSKNFVNGWKKSNIKLVILESEKPKNFGIKHQDICINIGSALKKFAFAQQKVKEIFPKATKFHDEKLENIYIDNPLISELKSNYTEIINLTPKPKFDLFNRKFKDPDLPYPDNFDEYINSNYESGLVYSTGYLELVNLFKDKNIYYAFNLNGDKINLNNLEGNEFIIICFNDCLNLSIPTVSGGKKSRKTKKSRKFRKVRKSRKVKKYKK